MEFRSLASLDAPDANYSTFTPSVGALYEAISEQAVKFSDVDRICNPNDAPYMWLIDLRAVILQPDKLVTIAVSFWDKMTDKFPFQVCGLEAASIPIITAILLKGHELGFSVTGFIVRKERKPGGLARQIEGTVNDSPVVVVDDIFNSGLSARKVLSVLNEIGVAASSIFTVIDYRSPAGRGVLEEFGLSVTSIFHLGQFGLHLGMQRWRPSSTQATVLWRFNGPPADPINVVPRSAPVFSDGRVLYATDDGHLWCLRAETGEVDWVFRVQRLGRKNIYSTPTVFERHVFFGAYDGNVYAVDLDSGREIWRNTDADWVGSSAAICAGHDRIVIGLEHALRERRGSIAGLRRSTGELLWNFEVGHYVHATALYAPELGLAAIGGNDGNFRAFEPVGGKLVWQTSVDGPIKQSAIFSRELRIFCFGTDAGSLYALDGETGAVRWRYTTDNSINSTPCLIDGTICIGSSDKFVHFVDAQTGEAVEKRPASAKVYATPRLHGGSIYVGTTGGRLLVFDRVHFSQHGDYQFHDRITNAVAIDSAGHKIFVPFMDNSLLAIRPAPDPASRNPGYA